MKFRQGLTFLFVTVFLFPAILPVLSNVPVYRPDFVVPSEPLNAINPNNITDLTHGNGNGLILNGTGVYVKFSVVISTNDIIINVSLTYGNGTNDETVPMQAEGDNAWNIIVQFTVNATIFYTFSVTDDSGIVYGLTGMCIYVPLHDPGISPEQHTTPETVQTVSMTMIVGTVAGIGAIIFRKRIASLARNRKKRTVPETLIPESSPSESGTVV